MRGTLFSRVAILVAILLEIPASGQTYLGRFTGYAVNGKAVTVQAGAAGMRFLFYKPDIVRIDYLPGTATVFDTSLVIIRDTTNDVPIAITDSATSLTIASSGLSIVCSKTPLRVSYYDQGGRLLLEEGKSGGLWWNGSSRGASFQLGPDDHFYGTGERGTALDKRGEAFDSYNIAIGGYSTPLGQMNINIPFVADKKGYALYFENSYPGRFDFGNTISTLFMYSVTGGELSYFLIAAPDLPAQLQEYVWLTGRQPLPPRWAFGYIQSKFGYHSETEARGIVQTMRTSQIPCDGIILDLYWYNQMGDLAWDLSAFPHPGTMVRDFLSEGIKTIVITEPYVTQFSPSFSEGDANHYFARDSGGATYVISNWWSCGCNAALLDITNPGAQSWWWQKYPRFMGQDSSGVSGLWSDLGEPENHPGGMLHVLGSSARVHNVYSLLWAKVVFDGFNVMRPNSRIFNLARSGYAGIQRYGAIPWSGDVAKTFGGLAVQVPMLLNMGMSGLVYHNSDIGGFCCGTTTDELYVRWMQYGTFCPITRAHGVGEALGGQGTEPWAFSPAAESIAVSFIRLRYQLLPYIYSMAYKSYESGMPLARPLFFAWPYDPALVNESSSYMWGDELLVSPVVVDMQRSKTVYLPQGRWIDYWTESLYNGGQSVTVSAPLERMPIFVKAGSIIPMQPAMVYSDERPSDTLRLVVFPVTGIDGHFTLYEDDGRTLAYQSGASAKTELAQSSSGTGSSLIVTIGQTGGMYTGRPSRRVYLSEIHGVLGKPSSVLCNGQAIPEATSYLNLRQGATGFFYDPALQRLYIQTPSVPDSSYVLLAEQVLLTGAPADHHRPEAIRLEQNYPNPFNPSTTIRYELPCASLVTLTVYDMLGREVSVLVNERIEAGVHEVKLDGSGLSSGVYFYRIQAGSFSQTRELLLLK